MKHTSGMLLLLVTAFLLLPTSAAQQLGRVLYVNNQNFRCNGQYPCYRTIQAAIDAAQPRDTIRIQSGTYREQLLIEKNSFPGATELDRIVIEPDPSVSPATVIFTGSHNDHCSEKAAIRIKASKFITVRGLTVTGTGAAAITLMSGKKGNLGIHIEGNRIFGNGGKSCNGGITVGGRNAQTLIVNNLIYANGRNGITLVGDEGGPHFIVSNTIYANQWNGIEVSAGHEVFIANNIITRNGVLLDSKGERFGIQRKDSKNALPQRIHLLNNLVCGNGSGEINGPALESTDSGNLTPDGTEGSGTRASPGCEIPARVFANVSGPDGMPHTVDDDFTLVRDSPAVDGGMDPRSLGLSVLFNRMLEADVSTHAIRPSDGDADRLPAFDIGAIEFENTSPIADAGGDQAARRGAFVTLDGTRSRDPDGTALTFQWTIVSQPDGSTIELNSPTSVRPQFIPHILGTYVFRLLVSDGELNGTPDTVQVNVANSAPMANSIVVSTNEDSGVAISLRASDVDDAGLSFAVISGPSKGTLESLSDASCVRVSASVNCIVTVTYIPSANDAGLDYFTFKVNDGHTDSNLATVAITVNATNDAPTAENATVNTTEDTPVRITLSAADSDSANLTFAIGNGPIYGTLGIISAQSCAVKASGASCSATVTYTPAVNYNGWDSLTFRVNDGE